MKDLIARLSISIEECLEMVAGHLTVEVVELLDILQPELGAVWLRGLRAQDPHADAVLWQGSAAQLQSPHHVVQAT